MNEIKIRVIPTGNEADLFIGYDKLTEILSKYFSCVKCYLFRSTGVTSKRSIEVYEGDFVLAYCKITKQKVEGEVVFKDGAFFVKDVCFPYLSDFIVLECAVR